MKSKLLSIILLFACLCLLVSCGGEKKPETIAEGEKRSIVFSLVSTAENSSTDYAAQYGYIQDIHDGRGYTAGIIGFTTGTGDLIDVVYKYVELKPEDNELEGYIPALRAVIGSDSHKGLDPDFPAAWKRACNDPEMIAAQDAILDEQYMTPSLGASLEDGLSVLGQYIYYDAIVVHGPGETMDSFGGIRRAAKSKAKTPAEGGEEKTYLEAFLEARTKVMLMEEAHSDLSRLNVQQKFIDEGNFNLDLPLEWTMYGDKFRLG